MNHYIENLDEIDVFVFRGIPGSGKSTLRRNLISKLSARNHNIKVRIASADLYFEKGAGTDDLEDLKRHIGKSEKTHNQLEVTPDMIYAYWFSESKLKDAHQYCFQEFGKGVEEIVSFRKAWKGIIGGRDMMDTTDTMGIPKPILILDNTNSTKWEYQKYIDIQNGNPK